MPSLHTAGAVSPHCGRRRQFQPLPEPLFPDRRCYHRRRVWHSGMADKDNRPLVVRSLPSVHPHTVGNIPGHCPSSDVHLLTFPASPANILSQVCMSSRTCQSIRMSKHSKSMLSLSQVSVSVSGGHSLGDASPLEGGGGDTSMQTDISCPQWYSLTSSGVLHLLRLMLSLLSHLGALRPLGDAFSLSPLTVATTFWVTLSTPWVTLSLVPLSVPSTLSVTLSTPLGTGDANSLTPLAGVCQASMSRVPQCRPTTAKTCLVCLRGFKCSRSLSIFTLTSACQLD